jgi:hypothetical protein
MKYEYAHDGGDSEDFEERHKCKNNLESETN